jgi:hypothetical protein
MIKFFWLSWIFCEYLILFILPFWETFWFRFLHLFWKRGQNWLYLNQWDEYIWIILFCQTGLSFSVDIWANSTYPKDLPLPPYCSPSGKLDRQNRRKILPGGKTSAWNGKELSFIHSLRQNLVTFLLPKRLFSSNRYSSVKLRRRSISACSFSNFVRSFLSFRIRINSLILHYSYSNF